MDITNGSLTDNIESAGKKDALYIKILKRIGGTLYKVRFYLMAFFIPMLLMGVGFIAMGIYPFGDRQIMVIDAWHQYYPFLSELQTKLQNLDSLMYSWNGGLGTNFIVMMSYYAASPVYLLSVLFPKEYLREFMALATMLKIGCSGLFFAIYIKGMFKKNDIASVGFSILYALSAYAIGYYWCIMWLDCMSLLPLIMLGMNGLLSKNKIHLYAITLGIAIISNYYIGAFVCEFIALYYFVQYFIKFGLKGYKHFFDKLGRMLAASLLGVGLAAIILIPTYYGLKLTANFNSTFPKDIKIYASMLEVFNNMLVGIKPATRAGLPNIHCGLIAVILVVIFMLSNRINLREKMLNGALILFLVFSFNINYLDFLWHGMHFPNEIPFRYAFVFSFLILTIAYKAFLVIDSVPRRQIGLLMGASCVYLVVAETLFKNNDKFPYTVFYISLAFAIAYFGVLLLYKYDHVTKPVMAALLFVVIFAESGYSAIDGIISVKSSQRSSYTSAYNSTRKVVNRLYETDTDFYRLDFNKWFTTNDPALYGYRGISIFSSEANSNISKFLQKLGLASTAGSNRYLYDTATPVVNSMLSLKYLLSKKEDYTSYGFSPVDVPSYTDMYTYEKAFPDRFYLKPLARRNPAWQMNPFSIPIPDVIKYRDLIKENFPEHSHYYEAFQGETILSLRYLSTKARRIKREREADNPTNLAAPEKVYAFKNANWLPIGFMVKDAVKDWKNTKDNTLEIQEEFFSAASGIDGRLYRNLYPTQTDPNNMEPVRSEYGVYTYKNNDSSKASSVIFTFEADRSQYYYAYAKVSRGKKVKINANSRSNELEANRGVLIDVGFVVEGEEMKFTFECDAADSGSLNLYVAGFDQELYEQMNEKLYEQPLVVESFTDTKIKGTVNVLEDGLLYTSIPYEKGWHVKVDGVEAKIEPLKDAFVMVPMTAGQHTVEFYYITDGLPEGVTVTCLSIGVLVIAGLLNRQRSKRRAKKKRG